MPLPTIPSAPEWTAITCELASALQEHRAAAGLSVHDMSQRVGIAPESYAAWEAPERERAHVNPPMRRLALAAEGIGVDLADLLDLHLLRGADDPPVRIPQAMLDDERAALGDGAVGAADWWPQWCEAFGLRIRVRRFQVSVSLAAAALSIDRDRRVIADVETARNPGLPLLLTVELSRALGCSLVDLLPVTSA